MALQLASDHCKKAIGIDEQVIRQKTFVYMQIDALNRRADLAKLVGDYEFAMTDFEQVIKLCKEHPDKNEQTLISAIFSLAKCQMDIQKTSEAK